MIEGQELSKNSCIFTFWFNNEQKNAQGSHTCLKWTKKFIMFAIWNF